MTSLRLGLAQWQVTRSAGVAGWRARLERELDAGVAAGAELLVLPEYAALECVAGDVPDVAAELRAACDAAPALLAAAREVARARGVWLLPGTLPMREGARAVNRAPLIRPDGAVAFQDKHVMTRFEAEEWGMSAGAPPAVFETDWGRVGISVCFDLEFPNLVRAQVAAGAWLVLAPSCTEDARGFNRVRIAAAARAMENQCFVGVAPTVGDAPWSGTLDRNRGWAGVFGPADRGFAEDGVVAAGVMDAPQWVVVKLDPARIAAVRREGAVLNHAAWPADPPGCRVVVPG